MATIYTTKDGDQLDGIAWRHYGTSVGAVEAILNANYALSEQPPVLPAGIEIALPDLMPAPATSTIRLWD